VFLVLGWRSFLQNKGKKIQAPNIPQIVFPKLLFNENILSWGIQALGLIQNWHGAIKYSFKPIKGEMEGRGKGKVRGLGLDPCKEANPISVGTKSLLHHTQEKASIEIQQGKKNSNREVLRVDQNPTIPLKL